MRCGLVSDIHGCYKNLEKALETFKEEKRKVEKILCAGDIFNLYLSHKENKKILDAIKNHEINCVLGNHDIEMIRKSSDQNEIIEYLKTLNEKKRIDDILLIHGHQEKINYELSVDQIFKKYNTKTKIIIKGHDHKNCPLIYDKRGLKIIKNTNGHHKFKKPAIIHPGCLLSTEFNGQELFNPAYAILDTDKNKVEFFFL